MKVKRTKLGLSLMEEIVVVAIIALLVAFGLPAARSLYKSVEAEAGGKAMISAAFSAARAIAAKEQRYAGVRFQYAYYKDDPNNSPLKASQYMIFIVHDPANDPDGTGLDNGFRAVKGIKPIKLPDSVGVIDLMVRTSHNPTDPSARSIKDKSIEEDDLDDTILGQTMTDTSAFSIIFSPSGKMVIHEVRIRNKDGQGDFPSYSDSLDDIFNKKIAVEDGIAMFYQDDHAELGLGAEKSRRSFVIYDREEFKNLTDKTQRWNYLKYFVDNHKETFINPYTGTMIDK